MNYSQESFVELLRWVRLNLPLLNSPQKSHYKSIILRRVLLKYWDKFDNIVYYRTSLVNHIRNQSFWTEFCWTIDMSWTKSCTIEYLSQITLQINHSNQSFVPLSSGVGKNVSLSNSPHKLYYKSIILTRVLLNYWDEFEKAFYYRTYLTNHNTNQSFSTEFC